MRPTKERRYPITQVTGHRVHALELARVRRPGRWVDALAVLWQFETASTIVGVVRAGRPRGNEPYLLWLHDCDEVVLTWTDRQTLRVDGEWSGLKRRESAGDAWRFVREGPAFVEIQFQDRAFQTVREIWIHFNRKRAPQAHHQLVPEVIQGVWDDNGRLLGRLLIGSSIVWAVSLLVVAAPPDADLTVLAWIALTLSFFGWMTVVIVAPFVRARWALLGLAVLVGVGCIGLFALALSIEGTSMRYRR